MYTRKTEEETAHLGGELCVLCIGLSWQLLGDGRLSPSEQCNLPKQNFILFAKKNTLSLNVCSIAWLNAVAEDGKIFRYGEIDNIDSKV